MFEVFLHPATWATLVMLAALEIVLSIDNLVFIAIISSKLPAALQKRARQAGLAMAVTFRVGLLATASWLIGLTAPLFTVFDSEISARDLVLIVGGFFLIWKATKEVHERVSVSHNTEHMNNRAKPRFWPVVAQIAVIDVVFSLDSIITAVGLAQELIVMIAAVLLAVLAMIIASEPLARVLNAFPTIVMLALAFLIMIGMTLVANGFDYEVPKSFLYIAMLFSVGVEVLNEMQRRAERRRGPPPTQH